MGEVAAAINEGKRRKELVNKYTKGEEKSLLSKVNLHTFGKKTMRFNQKLFHSQKDDAEFQIQEKKLHAIEIVAKKLIKRVSDYLTVVRTDRICRPWCLKMFAALC